MAKKASLGWVASLAFVMVPCLAGIAAVPTAARAELTTATAMGSGPSKEQAVASALRRAVRAAADEFLSSKAEAAEEEHSVLLAETILASAGDFVAGHEILNARQEEDEYAARNPDKVVAAAGMWEVQVQARVDVEAVKQRWAELAELLAVKVPAVLVCGQDTVDGEAADDSVAAALLLRELGKLGLTIVPADKLTPAHKNMLVSVAETGRDTDKQLASSIAKDRGADIFIVVLAEVRSTPDVQAHTTVKSFRTVGAVPLATRVCEKMPASRPGQFDPAGRALKAQARLTTPDVIVGVLRAWPDALTANCDSAEGQSPPKETP